MRAEPGQDLDKSWATGRGRARLGAEQGWSRADLGAVARAGQGAVIELDRSGEAKAKEQA